MNLKNLHKAQLKAAIYKLIACPGVLNENEVYQVLCDVVTELGDDMIMEADNAECVCKTK